MTIGIIIIFQNKEKIIDRDFFIQLLKHSKNITICLVNNSSNDNTLPVLKSIHSACPSEVSILEIKKYKTENFAIKAGARFLNHNHDLNHLGFINTLKVKSKEKLSALLKTIVSNEHKILNYSSLKEVSKKGPLHTEIFSVVDYLKIENPQLQ